MLQKEKEAKEENEYYKNKQNAWQQFQNRTQQKRKRLVAEGVIADRICFLNNSLVAFKKASIFRTTVGTERTSGNAPIERVMTPAPKRTNTQFKKYSCLLNLQNLSKQQLNKVIGASWRYPLYVQSLY